MPWGDVAPEADLALLTASVEQQVALRQDAPRAEGAGGLPRVLSACELEVLERIAAGDSNKLVARALDLSPHTVKRHVANILYKLDLATRGQAAAWRRTHQTS